MNPQEYNKNSNQWQTQPVTLQTQHYAPGPGPAWNTGWCQQQQQNGYWVQPHYGAGVYHHPPPPPSQVAAQMFHQPRFQQQPRHGRVLNTHASKFTNYLSSKPPRGTQKRKRKKDIVPPVEKMTEDAVVRLPVDESERLEIEAWKAERRKHWPSADNIRRKESEHASDTRKIRLIDVLDTQKKLGLTRKAGTDELVKQHLHVAREGARQQGKNAGAALEKRAHKRKPTLLERLLERDIKTYKAKILQMFNFVHMNNYLQGPEKPLLFPEGTLSSASRERSKQAIVPYEDSSVELSGSEATSSG